MKMRNPGRIAVRLGCNACRRGPARDKLDRSTGQRENAQCSGGVNRLSTTTTEARSNGVGVRGIPCDVTAQQTMAWEAHASSRDAQSSTVTC